MKWIQVGVVAAIVSFLSLALIIMGITVLVIIVTALFTALTY